VTEVLRRGLTVFRREAAEEVVLRHSRRGRQGLKVQRLRVVAIGQIARSPQMDQQVGRHVRLGCHGHKYGDRSERARPQRTGQSVDESLTCPLRDPVAHALVDHVSSSNPDGRNGLDVDPPLRLGER